MQNQEPSKLLRTCILQCVHKNAFLYPKSYHTPTHVDNRHESFSLTNFFECSHNLIPPGNIFSVHTSKQIVTIENKSATSDDVFCIMLFLCKFNNISAATTAGSEQSSCGIQHC